MEIVRINADEKSWIDLTGDWDRQCEEFGESLSELMGTTLSFLANESVEVGNRRDCGVFALKENDNFSALFWANSTWLPKVQGKVLRVRHLVLSPKYDFGDFDENQYVQLLTGVFTKIVELSDNELGSRHIKIHFRSPNDLQFFTKFSKVLGDTNVFKSVSAHGAWLQIEKNITKVGSVGYTNGT